MGNTLRVLQRAGCGYKQIQDQRVTMTLQCIDARRKLLAEAAPRQEAQGGSIASTHRRARAPQTTATKSALQHRTSLLKDPRGHRFPLLRSCVVVVIGLLGKQSRLQSCALGSADVGNMR